MKEDIAQRWVDALRSGKYSQAKGSLQKIGGFCCLGVLCEIAVEDGIIPAPVVDKGEVAYGGDDELKDTDLPPQSVEDWSGLDVRKTYVVNGLDETLYGLNDDRGFTFNQIADVIEKAYLREDD